jgi:hypothetical protein
VSINFKERAIKYLGRDFQNSKRDLMEFTKAHHSGVFQDFNETSPGMALLELTAYIGDVLSFYQDMQFEEMKQESARQIENVTSFAKRLGYRPSGKRSARGIVSVFCEVPATTVNGARVPDEAYSPIMHASSKLQGPNGVIFETLNDIIFSASAPTENTSTIRLVTGSQYDTTTGLPTHFALRKDVEVIAAETVTDVVQIGSFEQFKTVELAGEDVVEILSVNDSDGNNWYQVDYLPQEVVFDASVNDDADSATVPYVLKLRPVPRRFVVDRDPTTNKTSLIFGSGDGLNFDDELIPNVSDFALPISGRSNFTSFSLDPQNFLKTSTLGLSPHNTTLSIDYRVGGGAQTNVPPGSIKSVNTALLDFTVTGLNPGQRSDVVGSIECLNVKKTEGGAPEETISEIKANSPAFFAAQNRAVTREDYIARVYSMPAKFGKIEKALVHRDAINALALDIHVLAKDENGNLAQATPTLINNLKRYLAPYRMLTDGINILRSDIINLRVDFGVVVSPKFNRTEVLAKCLNVIKEHLSVDNMQIAQPIVLSDLSSLLQNVVGVISVYSLKIKNVFGNMDGLLYEDNTGRSVRFDTQAWTQNGILYCPEGKIFEIKYPNKDINGESK